MTNIKKIDKKFIFNTKDFILYILNRIEPAKSDKIRLNKIAFFVEFAYIFYNNKYLSDAKYAAIHKGPVIDCYDMILKEMEKEKLIKINGYKLRPLVSSNVDILDNNISNFIESIIDKYSKLSRDELISLSHDTDSYKITTNNDKEMGKIINKNLANLESFFCDNDNKEIDEKDLPVFDKSKLVEYEL